MGEIMNLFNNLILMVIAANMLVACIVYKSIDFYRNDMRGNKVK